jgi:hypothetical protein
VTGAWTRVVRTPIGSGAGSGGADPLRLARSQARGREIVPVIWMETDEHGSSRLLPVAGRIDPDVSLDGRR